MIAFIISLAFYAIIGILFWKFKLLKRRYMEPLFMLIMIFGIVALCQPLFLPLYTYGFTILLTGTLGYIFSIHLK